jgi:outer membrane scaffolding protein for murein synthesis (MipA/OmpV family)
MRKVFLNAISIIAMLAFEASARNTQLLDYSKNENKAENEWTGFLAAGTIILPEFDGSEDYQVIPALAGQANKGNYYIAVRGLQAMGNVIDSSRFNAGPMVQFRFGRDGDSDNRVINQLSTVDDAIELGAFASWINRGIMRDGDNLELTVELLQDVANGHGGLLGEVGATYFTPVTQQLFYSASGFLNYQSEDYMDAYFSVDAASSARSGLARFDAGGGFNSYTIGNQLLYSVDRNWGVVGILNYTRLINDAASSPIVEREGNPNQLLGIVGVTYRY